jgi:hypothetical protein
MNSSNSSIKLSSFRENYYLISYFIATVEESFSSIASLRVANPVFLGSWLLTLAPNKY